MPLTPLDEPIMSDAALRNWTVAAVTEAFTLGHHDWRLRLAGIRGKFTDSGYEAVDRFWPGSTTACSSTGCATTSRSPRRWPGAPR